VEQLGEVVVVVVGGSEYIKNDTIGLLFVLCRYNTKQK